MPRALPVLLALALCAGCHVSINDPGSEPPPGTLYFPSGLTLDPDGTHLYVSNANSDLRYGGGTVQVVDVKRFDCAVRRFQDPGFTDPACPNAADDATVCQADPLDPMMVDCGPQPDFQQAIPNQRTPSPFILADQTVKIGNFAGEMVLQSRGTDTRRLFVAVRGDPSVTWIDISGAGGAPRLDCFDPGSQAATAGRGCDPSHLVQSFSCVGQPSCTMTQNQLPAEPFGLGFDQGKLADGSDFARLLVAHQAGGQVSLIDARATPVLLDVSPAFFTPVQEPDGTTRNGAFALAPMHPGDPGTSWYLTSNLTPTLSTFHVADIGVVVPSLSFSVSGLFPFGTDVRDIKFEAGGARAFFTENNPPTLLVLDTRPVMTAAGPGEPANQVVDSVDVCQTPSHITVEPVTVEGAPGEPPRHTSRIFVVCFLSNQVMVVDPDLPAVLDTVVVGRGPDQLVISDARSDFLPHRRAYVTNFSESTIGVIDLDDDSPTRDRMVARIGIPVPPPPVSSSPVVF